MSVVYFYKLNISEAGQSTEVCKCYKCGKLKSNFLYRRTYSPVFHNILNKNITKAVIYQVNLIALDFCQLNKDEFTEVSTVKYVAYTEFYVNILQLLEAVSKHEGWMMGVHQ